MKALTLLLFNLLILGTLHSVVAQKPAQDPRTMIRPNSKTTPIEQFKGKSATQPLHTSGQATSMGYATMQPIQPPTTWGSTEHQPAFKNSNELLKGQAWVDMSSTKYMLPVSKTAANQRSIQNMIEHLVDEYSTSFGSQSLNGQLTLDTLIVDDLGSFHWKFDQTIDGRPVLNAQVFVHVDLSGQVYAMHGKTVDESNIQWSSSYTNNGVLDQVKSTLKSEGIYEDLSPVFRNWLRVPDPVVNEIWHEISPGNLIPAYHVVMHPNNSEWLDLVVDAENGHIINRFSKICLDPHSNRSLHSNRVNKSVPSTPPTVNLFGGSFSTVTATDLFGKQVQMRTYLDPQGPYYMLWDTPSLDVERSEQEQAVLGGILTITANNSDWDKKEAREVVGSMDNTWNDRHTVSAHVNVHKAYRYYYDTFNRNSFDDKGATIRGVVHITYNGQPMLNAFWFNGVIGFGAAGYNPMPSSLDVVGHEFNHAVVQYTAGLVYQFQSGALDESYSDLFGNIIQNDLTMLVGEDLIDPLDGEAMRNMRNPSSSGIEYYRRQPAHMSEFFHMDADNDNGGVHYNSGIPNRAAAIVVDQIGFEKTGRIYYRALSNYLSRNSQFIDSRRALVQSAIDLFGPQSAEVAIIRQAHDIVGVYETDGSNPNPDPKPDVPPPVPPITGEKSLIAFMDEAGKIGLVDITNPLNITANYIQHPEAVARVSQQGLDRSQLSAPVHGQLLYFINTNNRLALVNLIDMQVYVFQDLYIHVPGDLWNVSVNPQGNLAALISAYTNDATLYFTDGSTISSLPILPETTGQGIKLSTVVYPDVVSWSPDPNKPRLVFDALNRISTKSGDYDFWSVFELDFAAGTMFNMIPGQPIDVSIGNITYSKLHPDVLAFNTMQNNTGVLDISLVDHTKNTQSILGLPNVSFGGEPLTDALRPTFSPDNKYLSFSSAQFGALFFLHLASNQLTPISLGVSIYNPHWFMFSGQYSTSDDTDVAEIPISIVLHDAYPNPFNPETSIRFDLPESSHVQYTVYDIAGRRVATLVNNRLIAGTHTYRFNAQGLASGVYIGRLAVSGTQLTQKITLIK